MLHLQWLFNWDWLLSRGNISPMAFFHGGFYDNIFGNFFPHFLGDLDRHWIGHLRGIQFSFFFFSFGRDNCSNFREEKTRRNAWMKAKKNWNIIISFTLFLSLCWKLHPGDVYMTHKYVKILPWGTWTQPYQLIKDRIKFTLNSDANNKKGHTLFACNVWLLCDTYISFLFVQISILSYVAISFVSVVFTCSPAKWFCSNGAAGQ